MTNESHPSQQVKTIKLNLDNSTLVCNDGSVLILVKWRCWIMEVLDCGDVGPWRCWTMEVLDYGGVGLWRCWTIEVFDYEDV